MSGDVISCYALGISRWELAHSVGFTESGVLPEQGGGLSVQLMLIYI
ncbi:hypothetical protein [Neptunomonas sp.]|nr:hypothetical protein [Neptunomonas sp.]